MRSPINIVGGFYKDPNKHWSAQDTLNWIPVKSERSGTRTEWQFRDAPGVKPLVKLGVNSGGDFIEAGPGRGLRNVEGKLFAVAGNTLFQITNDLVSIPYGTIPGVNRVSMAHNQYGSANQLLTVNGSAGYVFNTSTLVFEKITDTGYPGAFVADYVDGYLAQVESLGRYWFHSDLAEAREYNTLDQYEAEGDPDRIVTLHVAYREVLLFGADTIEPYVNAPRGSGIAPFQRAANTVIQCGCSAKFSPRNIAGVVPFLDDKRVVQYLQGYSVNRISTVGIEQALGECSREEIANAYAYTYEDRGHKIYYLTVPGRFTFGYDFLTQEWHRRATSGLPDLAFTDVAFWNGMWVALDRRYGRLYELDWGYKLDSCEPLVRERVTGVLSNNQNRVTVNELELLFNVGAEESVCQPFEEQPEGPTISGDAPDGSVGVPYSFAYTVGGGTPPLRVTIRPNGEAIPPGLSMTTAGVITGTPTEITSRNMIVRVTDDNGLWAEITDNITIATAMMMLRQTVSVVSADFMLSTGYDWSGAFTAEALLAGKPFLIGTEAAFIAYGISAAHPVRTVDFGATWTEATGTLQSGTGGSRLGWYSPVAQALMLPQALGNFVTLSTDDGESFAPTAISDSNGIAALELDGGVTRWVSVDATNFEVSTSDDLGVTVDTEALPADLNFPTVTIFSDGPRCYLGASNLAGTTARLLETEDGTTWTGATLPAITGTSIQRIGGGLVEGESRVVAWTNLGELLIRINGDWELAADQPDGIPRAAASNGAVLVINVNKDNPSDNEGIVYVVSETGELDERKRDTMTDNDSFTGLAALVPS